LIPVGILWKKADNAVSKDDFKEYAKEAREAHAELRNSLRDLYKNAESDRKLVRDGFDQLNKNINDARFDLLEKINERRV
jgi:soluble cytochrome b562